MSATESAARILTMVPWLLERQGATLAEVAQAVGSDVATVRGELEMLCYCGGPGLGGGSMFDLSVEGDRVTFSMAPGLRQPLRLTPPEALRLVLTLTAAGEVLGQDLPALESALAKVRAAAGIEPGAVMSIVDDNGHLGDLRAAITSRRVVEIAYRGRRDEQPGNRRLDPWQLELTDKGWYLHGFDLERQDYRVFRVDRIHEVQQLDEPVTHDLPDELAAPVWVAGDDAISVELALTGTARFLGDYVSPDVDEEVDGARRIVLQTDSPAWLAELVVGAGPGAAVVAPDHLREAVATAAQAGLAAYGRHTPANS